jgi:hypothetical protein
LPVQDIIIFDIIACSARMTLNIVYYRLFIILLLLTMNTHTPKPGNDYKRTHMAGHTPYQATAYIAVLAAGTPSSSSEAGTSPVLRPERKSQRGGMARKKRRTKSLISDEATEHRASLEKRKKSAEELELEYADATVLLPERHEDPFAAPDDDEDAIEEAIRQQAALFDMMKAQAKGTPNTPPQFKGSNAHLQLIVVTVVTYSGVPMWARISPVGGAVYNYLAGLCEWFHNLVPMAGLYFIYCGLIFANDHVQVFIPSKGSWPFLQSDLDSSFLLSALRTRSAPGRVGASSTQSIRPSESRSLRHSRTSCAPKCTKCPWRIHLALGTSKLNFSTRPPPRRSTASKLLGKSMASYV